VLPLRAAVPLGLMIAEHIKPRSECSRRERLDAENIVFGVCLLVAMRFTSAGQR
jgi:hypothetical protein